MHAKKEKIYPANVSKHNSHCEKQVTLSMIPNRENWYYLSVKKTISIIKRNNAVFIACIAFIPTEQKPNLNHIKEYVKIKIFAI